MVMSDQAILIALLVPCLVMAIVFHEVAHGWAAKALGDTTASDRGRLTLNPIKHVDPIGTLIVPGALAIFGGPIFGWAKPVPVAKHRLTNPRFGMMAVAAAGPLSNFALAVVAAILLGSVGGMDWLLSATATGLPMATDMEGEPLFLLSFLFYFLIVNIFLGLFNLLPIPPFDGSHIVGGLLPLKLRFHWERLQRVGMALFLVVIAGSWIFGTEWLGYTIGPVLEFALSAFMQIARFFAGG